MGVDTLHEFSMDRRAFNSAGRTVKCSGMNVLLVVGIGLALLVVASRTYSFWIARVFKLDDRQAPPSEQFADQSDYVKSPTQVVFAHHFASIAGAGPIIGPILALAFGWGPAWLWIIFGAIFFGAVHDMSSMCVSLREGGKTIAEIARRTLGNAGYLMFVIFLILVLCLINAIFLNLSAQALTSIIPVNTLGVSADNTVIKTIEDGGVVKAQIGGIATTSVFIMTLLAPLIGWMVHRRGMRGLNAFGLAAIICVASVIAGFAWPIDMYSVAWTYFDPQDAAHARQIAENIWKILLASYVFIGCWIPVWLLLQPRDFTNVQILYGGLVLLLVGSVIAGFNGKSIEMEELATLDQGQRALNGPVWPFLFITIACGAISGFHSLVATGTTIKQIPRETDCRRVGFNAMLLESFLALLVLAALASQLSRSDYMSIVWPAEGSGSPVMAFALACGRTFANLGIPNDVGAVLGILVIEGFLVTTLDTSVRLGRYLFEELWGSVFAPSQTEELPPAAAARSEAQRTSNIPAILRSKLFNTSLAVAGMLFFAFSALYHQIWTIFGSGNQLIGALALTTVSIWLLQRRRSWLFAAVPAAFMVVTTLVALNSKMLIDFQAGRMPLAFAGAMLLALAIGFVSIAVVRVWQEARKASAAGRDTREDAN